LKKVHPSIREIAVLQEATEMILSSLDVDTVLHQILLIVRNYFGATNCAVLLVDPSTHELYCRAQNGYEEFAGGRRRLRIGEEGVTGWVAQHKTPLYVPDVSREPRYIQANPRIQSELALPLVVRDDVVGVLDMESDKLDYFTDDMIGLLALFAGQAAVALENARLYSTERRRMRQIELINLIARSATAASNADQFLGTLAELIYDTFEGTEVCILLRDRDGSMQLQAHAGTQPPAPERLAASERSGAISQALASRMNVLINDVDTRPEWPACLENGGSELCVPLVSFGEVLGVVVVLYPRPNFFGPEDRSIAQASADVCATAIRNIQLSEELRRVTNTDSLTGLFNQRYFHAIVAQEISRAQRYGKQFSILMLDMVRFRQVNDALGFDRGDEVLRKVAQVLGGLVRSIDTVCRYTGDRFVLVLPETDHLHVRTVLAKVQQTLQTITIEGESSARPLQAAAASVNYPRDGVNELDLVRLLVSRTAQGKLRLSSSAGL